MQVGELQKRMEQVIRAYGYDFILSTDLLAKTVIESGEGTPPRRVFGRYGTRGPGIHGQTQHDVKRVYVRDDLSPEDIARTTAHELAHIALRHGDDAYNPLVRNLFRLFGDEAVIAPAEVEAETVADLVTGHYGYQDTQWSLEYVKGWLNGGGAKRYMDRDATVRKVSTAADHIIKMIDTAN